MSDNTIAQNMDLPAPERAETIKTYPVTPANLGCCGFSWRRHTLAQKPGYPCETSLYQAEQVLQNSLPIVPHDEVQFLRNKMKHVVSHKGFVLQVGDCAETFRHGELSYTSQRLSLFAEMHHLIQKACKGPVVTMGRMAGQFAKPRSQMTEVVNGKVVSSYFGDAVNHIDVEERDPDPQRLIIGHTVAFDTVVQARLFSNAWSSRDVMPFRLGENFFVCHEAYLMPYEQNLLRFYPGQQSVFDKHKLDSPLHRMMEFSPSQKNRSQINGNYSVYGSSAHFMWIGERTRSVDHCHVKFAQHIDNPVGVKIGPNATEKELVNLIEALNPHDEAGRLTFIFRLGVDNCEKLKTYAAFLKSAGLDNKIVWVCDPMHGNTQKTGQDIKTRYIDDILYEIDSFFKILHHYHIYPAGVHMEVTPHKVLECVINKGAADALTPQQYLTTCDPRLNAEQALLVCQHIVDLLNHYESV